jgi:antitoxin ParD1/3/4
MATSTLNISLPETMRVYVEEKIKNEGYGTISEYVRELIRADQKRKEQGELEAVLVNALNRGEPAEFSERTWDNLKAKVRGQSITGGK